MGGTHVKLVLLRELIQFASANKFGAERQRVVFDREYGVATARHFPSRVSGNTVSGDQLDRWLYLYVVLCMYGAAFHLLLLSYKLSYTRRTHNFGSGCINRLWLIYER